MTDREVDERLQRALLDALRDEWEETPADETPLSARQQRRMQAMLRDPNGYCRKKSRPVWKRAARTAASFFLVCTVSLTLLLAVSPGIRAEVLRWAREVRDGGVFYRFAGEDMEPDGLRYTIVKLPDGYVKTDDRTEERGFFRVSYRNDLGQEIVLSCADSAKGVVLEPEGRGPAEDVAFTHLTGRLYPALDPSGTSALVWEDQEEQAWFMIEAPVDRETLEDMAIWVFPELPRYRLSELPAGVVPWETPMQESPSSVHLMYVDENDYFFSLSWSYMRQGSGMGVFSSSGGELHSKDVTVNGMSGQYYWSDDPGESVCVVWVDEEENLMFTLDGMVSEAELLRLAAGVVPVD